MSIIERQLSYYFNSAAEAGARVIGSIGNQFEVQLDDPISIPRNALYATLEVVSASIWNTSPNISEDIGNNHFRFSVSGTPYDIEIADGTYGVEELDAYINYFLVNEELEPTLIELSANESSQRVVMSFSDPTTIIIDFTTGDTCRDVLGFDANLVSPQETSIFADNEARFNRISSYFIKSNLLSGGIPQNTRSNGIITGVPITAKIGSLINYAPTNPIRSNADELIGQSKQYITFTLLDQLERDIGTAGESWTLAIVIRYSSMVTGTKQSGIHSGANVGLL